MKNGWYTMVLALAACGADVAQPDQSRMDGLWAVDALSARRGAGCVYVTPAGTEVVISADDFPSVMSVRAGESTLYRHGGGVHSAPMAWVVTADGAWQDKASWDRPDYGYGWSKREMEWAAVGGALAGVVVLENADGELCMADMIALPVAD